MANLHELSPSSLLPLLGTPACPALVDVCTDEDFALDPVVIPGAVRHAFDAPAALGPRLSGRRAVIVCQKGLKLSHGVAAWLRSEGVDALALSGGMTAWRALPGAPVVRGAHLAPLWAVPDGAGPEEAALRWLIRRWIAPAARCLAVPAEMVDAVADRFAARPAHGGFHAALEEAGLSTPALMALGKVLGGAPWLRTALAGAAALGRDRDRAECAIFGALYAGLADPRP